MKKCLLLLLLVPMFLSAQKQQKGAMWSYYRAFDMSTITGTDSVIYYEAPRSTLTKEMYGFGGSVAVEIEYKSMDANDATFDVGSSNSGETFNTLLSAAYTLNTADSAQVNGTLSGLSVYKASKEWIVSKHPNSYMPIKITKGSVTSGILYIWIKQWWN